MDCPSCGAPVPLGDRVCRKCRWFFEEGRTLPLEPPRAADAAAAAAVRARRPLRERLRERLQELRGDWRAHAAAGIVPGLGHVFAGRGRRGAALAALFGALFCASIPLFASVFGQFLFGFAVAVHAYAIFDLTPWREDPRPLVRVGAVVALVVGLQLAYRPLVSLLERLFPNVVYAASRGQAYGLVLEQTLWGLIVVVVLLFGLSRALRMLRAE